MPSREKVEAFVALVEKDKFVEALQEFYADGAIAQENGEPPRVGLQRVWLYGWGQVLLFDVGKRQDLTPLACCSRAK